MGIVSLPSFGSDPVTITAAGLDGKVDPLATEFNGNVDNDNIKASAGITYSKLNLTGSIVDADISGSAAITASKVNLGTIAQDINEAKGADVASATTTTIWVTDGNFIHITGTTTITSFGTAPQAGAERTIVFDGILTLTHNATSLILPGGANITTAAGDRAIVRAETAANARVISYVKADGTSVVGSTPTAANALSGSVIQVVNTQTGEYATATASIPKDDSIPQNTEGMEVMTLAITPTNASNKLKIEVACCWSCPNAADMAIALFQDSTANAIAAVCETSGAANYNLASTLTHYMTAGTTSSTTFKVRIGPGSSQAIHFNGNAVATARIYGGVSASSITITEIKA
jgi:hypothetical protein